MIVRWVRFWPVWARACTLRESALRGRTPQNTFRPRTDCPSIRPLVVSVLKVIQAISFITVVPDLFSVRRLSRYSRMAIPRHGGAPILVPMIDHRYSLEPDPRLSYRLRNEGVAKLGTEVNRKIAICFFCLIGLAAIAVGTEYGKKMTRAIFASKQVVLSGPWWEERDMEMSVVMEAIKRA